MFGSRADELAKATSLSKGASYWKLTNERLPRGAPKQARYSEMDMSRKLQGIMNQNIGKYVNLEKLWANENFLQKLPEDLGNCTKLREFFCSNNALSDLPKSMSQLTKLEILDLHSNGIVTLETNESGNTEDAWNIVYRFIFPPQTTSPLRCWTQLTQLILNNNNLTELPDCFQCCPKLKRVILHDNLLEKLPPSMCTLTALEELKLFNNSLKTLPTNLVFPGDTLDLSGNHFHYVPEIANPENIQNLVMYHNFLESLDGASVYTNLRLINVKENKLRKLPSGCDKWHNLISFYLSNNNIDELHQSLGNCGSLQILTLHHNQLKTIPLGVISKLEDCDVSYNNITDASSFMCESIRWLNLSNNPIGILPDSVSNLRVCRELNLENTQLRQVPPSIGQLTSLERIWLSNNPLSELPSEMSECSQLRALVINGTLIRSLPASFRSLTSLLEISFDRNDDNHEIETNVNEIIRNLHPPLNDYRCVMHYNDDVWSIDYDEPTSSDNNSTLSFTHCLDAAREDRDSNASKHKVKNMLNNWINEIDCEWSYDLVDTLSQNQVIMLLEWMTRLQNTRDWISELCSSEFREATHAIVHTVLTKKSFRELFFAQIMMNLERCGDRAAMAFNEIYVAWKLECMHDNDESERFRLCCAAAKTNTLRTVLAQANNDTSESVEMYLNIEVQLKDELGLLTFSKKSLYKSHWPNISIPTVKERVLSEWQNTLFDMLESIQPPIFSDFPMQPTEEISMMIDKRLNDLEELKEQISEAEYINRITVLQQERMRQLTILRQLWLGSKDRQHEA